MPIIDVLNRGVTDICIFLYKCSVRVKLNNDFERGKMIWKVFKRPMEKMIWEDNFWANYCQILVIMATTFKSPTMILADL